MAATGRIDPAGKQGWDGWEQAPSRARARRAVAVIALSLAVIAGTAAAYVRPLVGGPGVHAASGGSSTSRVTALDFVSAGRGWVVADLGRGVSALLHTDDAGATWTRQALLPTDGQVPYLKFFDDIAGVVALPGGRPLLARTADAGLSWSVATLPGSIAAVLSWSFVDWEDGWLLAAPDRAGAPPRLWRTDDGARDWVDLGPPVAGEDQAFTVQMAFLTTGWLASVGSRPYAYRSIDFGASWQRVELPVPARAGQSGGSYFVAVQPLHGLAAIASVVYMPVTRGRSGIGGAVLAFPPLTVRVFDGGKPAAYTYATALATAVGQPAAGAPAPGEVLLRTLDGGATWTRIERPLPDGALGCASPTDWWWVGAGLWAGSADGGATWNLRHGVGVLAPAPGLLQVLDARHAWLAGTKSGRPVLEETADAGRDWRTVMLPPVDAAGYVLT
jgi:photosystem II stability/assembly factor-like uncharacterized protein